MHRFCSGLPGNAETEEKDLGTRRIATGSFFVRLCSWEVQVFRVQAGKRSGKKPPNRSQQLHAHRLVRSYEPGSGEGYIPVRYTQIQQLLRAKNFPHAVVVQVRVE